MSLRNKLFVLNLLFLEVLLCFFKMPRERKLKVYDPKYKWGSINNGHKIKWYHVLIQLSKLFCLKAWGKFLFIFISFFFLGNHQESSWCTVSLTCTSKSKFDNHIEKCNVFNLKAFYFSNWRCLIYGWLVS